MKHRIYLEKISSKDFDKYYTFVGNERVMAMITERPLTKEEAREKFNYFLQNNELHPSFGTFKVFEETSKTLLGLAKLEIKNETRHEAELGYLLLPEFWGKGFGSEIAEVLLEVAKSDPKVTRVFAITDPNNAASRKILLKNGFISEKVGEMDGLPSEIFGRIVE